MMYKTVAEIDRVDDIPIIIHYTAHAATRGARDFPKGPAVEPDEPTFVEIDKVELEDGREVTLTFEQELAIEQEILRLRS